MTQKLKIGEKILEILATAGVVGFAALCEGMRDARWTAGGYTDYRVKRSLGRLHNKDLVVKIKTSSGPKWQLTPAGKELYDRKNLNGVKLIKPDNWDGRWRIVIFDIPESKRGTRNIFRRKLKELGFTLIQKSTFACPYPCRNEIMQTVEILNLKDDVRLTEGDYLSNDETLKRIYALS